jgi:tetratricopeptide (TPR) repeat protein/mono/diheme cytochrome c family protein
MRRVLILTGAAAALVFAALPEPAIQAGGVQAAEAPVTWSRHIAPILYANCTTCHHAGGSGPFALTSYADAKRWGGLLANVTKSRYMPPWLPAPGHGEFLDSRRLPDEQIALIQKWVAAGMPSGDIKEAPKPPVYSSDWQLGPPDLVLEVDSPTEVPASGTDLFRNFILPVPITETRWVRAMEIKPGSPQVVHHANLLIDRTASLRRLHPADWRAGIPGMDITVDSGEGFDPDSHFLDWKPDSAALVESPETPWRLDPGNDLVLNMHLKPTGKVESVRARIGLYFSAKPATRFPVLLQLEHDDALDIPPGDRNFVVEDQLTLPEAVDVLAIYPHAHYLGKRLEGWAALPGGGRTDLVLIPDWDINRQSIYRFAHPPRLPAGTVLHMRYVYDNGEDNPHNPNSPPIRVTNGNRSVDEMGHLWLQVLPVETTGNADARAPLLRAWMENRLRKDPADPTALFNLAALDLDEGAVQAATDLYRRALAARPADVRIATAYASALARSGDWQQAQQRLSAAVAGDSTYAEAQFDLAVLDLEHGQPAAAEPAFRAAIALQPANATAHAGLGSALAAEGDERSAEAETEFKAALRLDPANFDALYNLAHLEAASGRSAEALLHLEAAVRIRPADADAHRGLADLYAGSRRLADAIREQKTVLALEPGPDGWNNLGVLEARSGDAAAARKDFTEALALDPANSAARNNLARLRP